METQERIRKEIQINSNSNNFKIILGIANKKEPLVLYIKINSWANYLGDYKNYNEYIDKLNSNVKFLIKNELRKHEMFDNVFFYIPELKKTLNKNNTNMHCCFDLTIKQKQPIETDINKIKDSITYLSNKIVESIENNHIFSFSLNKKST